MKNATNLHFSASELLVFRVGLLPDEAAVGRF